MRVAVALAVVAALAAGTANARVYQSQKDALAQAFPDADTIERRNWILDERQAEAIERASRAPLPSRIATLHVARRGDQVIGYAAIDVHDVRTVPEALMVVLKPDGSVRSVRLLAFHEPEEYRPTERWLEQFAGTKGDQKLRLGDDIHTIAGSTLTSRAATRAVRRTLAFYRVLLSPSEPSIAGSEDASPGAEGD